MVLETAEFFADESNEAYWAFVETWARGTEPRDGAVQDEGPDAFFIRCASRVRDVAANVAGPEFRLGVLELSLGIRRYSPRLQMFRAVAQEHAEAVSVEEPEADKATPRAEPACCVARAGNAVASDLSTLRRMLADLERDPPGASSGAYSVPRASTLDHVYAAPTPAPALDPWGGEGSAGDGTPPGPSEGSAARTPPPPVTLYASLGSDCFVRFHDALRDAAERGAVRYVHRPVLLDAVCALQGDRCAALGAGFSSDNPGQAFSGDASAPPGSYSSPGGATDAPRARLTAAGYGVEMAIKNMEYKAIDDDSSANATASSASDDAAPELKLKQIRDLGLQATQRVVRSDDPLQTMMDLSFDFPAIAAELSAVRVDEATSAAAAENARKLSGGGSLVMSLNGEPLEMETVNVFSLLDRVADELKLADVFLSLGGLDHAAVRKLLRMRVAGGGARARGGDDAPDFPRLDIVDPERDPASPRFATDVEKDRAFKSWDPSLSGLLSPDQGGRPPRVRRNLLNFVVVIELGDPAVAAASRASWALVDALDRAAEEGIGFRVAHVLLDDRSDVEDGDVEDDPDLPPGLGIAAALARAHAALARRFGGRYAGEFLREVARSRPEALSANPFAPPERAGAPSWRDAERAFARAHRRGFRAAEKKRRKKEIKDGLLSSSSRAEPADEEVDADFEATLADALRVDGGSAAAASAAESRAFLSRRGIAGVSALVNGLHFTLDDARNMGADLSSVAFHLAQRELDAVARAVYSGELTDAVADADARGAYGWIHRGALRKRSAALELAADEEASYVVMKDDTLTEGGRGGSGDASDRVLAYAQRYPSAAVPVTAWVIADAGTDAGANLIAAAYAFVASSDAEDAADAADDLSDPGARAHRRAASSGRGALAAREGARGARAGCTERARRGGGAEFAFGARGGAAGGPRLGGCSRGRAPRAPRSVRVVRARRAARPARVPRRERDGRRVGPERPRGGGSERTGAGRGRRRRARLRGARGARGRRARRGLAGGPEDERREARCRSRDECRDGGGGDVERVRDGIFAGGSSPGGRGAHQTGASGGPLHLRHAARVVRAGGQPRGGHARGCAGPAVPGSAARGARAQGASRRAGAARRRARHPEPTRGAA